MLILDREAYDKEDTAGPQITDVHIRKDRLWAEKVVMWYTVGMLESMPLSADISALVERHIDGKQFCSADDVIKAALGLLEAYQTRNRDRLHADIKLGAEQVARGEVVTVDAAGLEEMFADIERQGFAQLHADS